MAEVVSEEGASLEAFRWVNRVLVFDARGELSSTVEDLLEQARQDDLGERKLLVLTVDDDGVTERAAGGVKRVSDLSADVLMNFLGKENAALIGLDGGLKGRYTFDDFAWADLNSRIDAMPMRRVEMRRNERGN